MKTIMLVPATSTSEVDVVAQGLLGLLTEKNGVTAAVLPSIDLTMVEDKLIAGRRDELLLWVFEQSVQARGNKDVLIIKGVSPVEPYALELNQLIATALDASIIFVMSLQSSAEKHIRQLPIITASHRQNKIIGVIANESMSSDNELLRKHCIANRLPLLGIIPRISSSYDIDWVRCFGDVLDIIPILKLLRDSIDSNCYTPTMFQHHLFSTARSAAKRIILPEGNEPRILQAANVCATLKIARPILLGELLTIQRICRENNFVLTEGIEIIDPVQYREKYVDALWELRRSKGLTREEAVHQLASNNVLGTMMLKSGEVDGLVSGAVHTTADTIRPALQIIKTNVHSKLVSSAFFMCLPEQVLVYADCAINPNPNAEELATIARQSAYTARAFGVIPMVAMLSYSTNNSGVGPDVDRVKSAVAIAKQMQPDLIIDGPLQYDAAVDPIVAALKAPQSDAAGRATVFIFPDLNAGNIAYKAVQRSGDIISMGPILQGLAKPVNDLSRGCSIRDIVATIAITAVQAVG